MQSQPNFKKKIMQSKCPSSIFPLCFKARSSYKAFAYEN